MNEITRIHLGRQPFTISVEAHRLLKAYLAEIHQRLADDEVANEVELRMAELLGERGITGDKVILPEDVEFLKQQLGTPAEFADGEAAAAEPQPGEPATKRLFRDPDAALIAGVCAGLANYFGIDAVLVRLIFVVLAVFGGGIGLVLYAVLWLVVPPAVTASEKLQMNGKPVTLGALKDSVSRADVSAAAQQASQPVLRFINGVFRVGIKLLGIAFMVGGLAVLLGLVALKVYMLLHHGQLFEENFFPVGTREQWLVGLGMILAGALAVFLVLVGVAVFKRRWPLPGWVSGVLVGLFMVTAAAALALSADVGPRVHDRYEESLHTTAVKGIEPFNTVKTYGGVDIAYLSSPNYSVNFHYSGNPDLSKIKVSVKNKTLYIDSTAFDDSKKCTMLCIFPEYDMTVEIAAPNVQNFDTPPGTEKFFPPRPAVAP